MSYHKFSNLREIFQGDLSTKIMEGIGSRDFINRSCNCNKSTLINGLCPFKGKCRHSMVVYSLKCKECNMTYIGQTQQTLKNRTNQHCNDVKKLVERGEASDSFAKHMAERHFCAKEKVKAGQVRKLMEIKVEWQGNPISCVKSFNKFSCQLCTKERLEIMKRTFKNPKSTINSCGEIFGACKHKTKFHRFVKLTVFCEKCTSTDEGVTQKGVKSKAKRQENCKQSRKAGVKPPAPRASSPKE